MRFTRQFFGGVMIGLALGLMLGAAVADGRKEVNYTSIAGVGILLIIPGAVMLRPVPVKS